MSTCDFNLSSSFKLLHDLLRVITTSLASLESSFNCAGVPFPSPSEPFQSNGSENHLMSSDEARSAVLRIAAACEQMVATVRTPMETLCDAAMGYNLPACLSVLEAAHVVEILREGGSQGMHVNDIVFKTPGTIDPMLLARILRLLATHHIVTEVSPDIFANNRISSFLDTKKTVEDIRQDTELKYDGTNGVAAFIGMCTHDIFKSSAYLSDSLGLSLSSFSGFSGHTASQFTLYSDRNGINHHPIWQHVSGPQNAADQNSEAYDWRPHSHSRTSRPHAKRPPLTPKTDLPAKAVEICKDICPRRLPQRPCYSNQPSRTYFPDPADQVSIPPDASSAPFTRAPFNLAFQTSASYFAWLEEAPQAAQLRRFGVAMRGTAAWEMGGVVRGFAWGSLPAGAAVVDVGGGIGAACMALADAFPHLRFVVQDRAPVVCLARDAWARARPAPLADGTVLVEEHDFFRPQRAHARPAVFLLRAVCHDWPDVAVARILRHLRAAAAPDTALVLGDHVMPYACVDDARYDGIAGAFAALTDPAAGGGAEGALLPNLGRGSANAYWVDLCMQVMFGAQERTLKHIVALARGAGWKVVRVNRVGCSLFAYVVCEPAPVPGADVEDCAGSGGGSS